MKIIFKDLYYAGLKKITKGNPSIIKKLDELVEEVSVSPKSGTGHPEPLKGYGLREVWSRHITKKTPPDLRN
jgi:toxin YoeB